MAVSLSAATSAYCPPGSANGACGAADVDQTATPFEAAAAEPSLLNVPANLFNAIANIPANEIAGLNLFAKSLEETGSLLVWSPTNVFGFDQADPDKLKSIIDLLIPFPALSTEIGRQSVIWAQANFPVNPGCAATPGACPHPEQIISELLQVPTYKLYEGYTFPTRVNPFDGSDVGYPDGYVKLDPNKPAQDFLDSLLAPPTGIQTVTLDQVGATFARLGAALFNSFYPFVQNSEYYNPEQTGLAYVFRALSPFLCANCNRDPADGYAGVYDNPYLYENYDPHFPPAASPATTTPDTLDASTAEGSKTDPLTGLPTATALTSESTESQRKLADVVLQTDPSNVADSAPESPKVPDISLPAANLSSGPVISDTGANVTSETETGVDTSGSVTGAAGPSTGTPAKDVGDPAEKSQGKHWKPGAQTSVPEKIKSTISKLTGGFNGTSSTSGGDAKTDAKTGATTAGNDAGPDKKPSSDKPGE